MKSSYPLLSASRFVVAVLLCSGTIALGMLRFLPSDRSLQNASVYPTAIPWLQNEFECLNTGRIWQEDKCWDAEHDANF